MGYNRRREGASDSLGPIMNRADDTRVIGVETWRPSMGAVFTGGVERQAVK